MAESEEWRLSGRVVVSISHVDVLAVEDSSALGAVAEIGRVLREFSGKGQGEFGGLYRVHGSFQSANLGR